MSAMKDQTIKRRDFLKVSGITAALAMTGSMLSSGASKAFVPVAKAQAASEDGWYPGVCKMCMQGDCQQRVHVVDGVVVKVEGEPRAIQNKGTLCPRGNAAIMQIYNPWRVKAPVKRTNPKKGLNEDPQFVEITWDEALNTVAEKLKAVRADDPRKVVLCSGFGVNVILTQRFLDAYGTPNNVPSRGSACAYHFGSYMVSGKGPDSVQDMDHCEYLINIARTLGPNIATSSTGTRTMLDAMERGLKIVNVDPRCSPEVSKSTEWVPIRPGTEQAFLLGVLYTVLHEIGTIDMWSVKNRTNGPYLIGPDGDYLRDKTSNKPLLWDEVENRARPFDEIPPMQSALEGTYDVDGVQASPGFQLIKDAIKEYTPEWAEGISTVPAATVRRIAKDFIDHAHIGSTIEIEGVTMPFRPVGIQYERGAYQHTIEGTFGDLVGKILCELVGCIEVPGGITGNSFVDDTWLTPDEDGVRKPISEAAGDPWVWPPEKVDSHTFYPVSHTLVQLMAKGILEPETYHLAYEPEVMITCGGGPIRSSFDRALFEKAYAKVPFHFSMSLTYDESAVMSDIVLPDTSFLEKDQYHPMSGVVPHKCMEDDTRGYRPFLWRDASKITRPYNAHTVDEMWLELAERVGILTGEDGVIARTNKGLGLADQNLLDINKPTTLREISEAFLKQVYGSEYSLDGVNDKSGPVYKYMHRGAKNYNYYYWPDNTTRYPMYFVQMIRIGNLMRKNLAEAGLSGVPGWVNMDDYWKAFVPIPVWTPCPEFDAPEEYDMWAINWKTPMAPFYCGDTFGNVWLHETMRTFDPYEYAIWINSDTAQKKGLKNGDTVVVESRYGKTTGKIKTTELIHPEVLGFPSGHGARSNMANPIVEEGPYFNALCSIHEKDQATDPLTGGIEEGPAVKIYKA